MNAPVEPIEQTPNTTAPQEVADKSLELQEESSEIYLKRKIELDHELARQVLKITSNNKN